MASNRADGGHPHYAAPTGAGVDLNVPPQFPTAGPAPVKSVTGNPSQVLGVVTFVQPNVAKGKG